MASNQIKRTPDEITDEISRLNERVNTLYTRLGAATSERDRQLLCWKIDETQGALGALQWVLGEHTTSTYSEASEITEAAAIWMKDGQLK